MREGAWAARRIRIRTTAALRTAERRSPLGNGQKRADGGDDTKQRRRRPQTTASLTRPRGRQTAPRSSTSGRQGRTPMRCTSTSGRRAPRRCSTGRCGGRVGCVFACGSVFVRGPGCVCAGVGVCVCVGGGVRSAAAGGRGGPVFSLHKSPPPTLLKRAARTKHKHTQTQTETQQVFHSAGLSRPRVVLTIHNLDNTGEVGAEGGECVWGVG